MELTNCSIGWKESAMDELIKLLAEKLGVSKETARKAAIITDAFLKTKLPATIYNDIEILLESKNITEEEKRELGLFQIP